MVARVGERWKRSQIQRREDFDARVSGKIGLMLPRTPLPLGLIAREQNGDGVQVRAVESAFPMIGMVRASVADHLGTGGHALSKFLGEGGERRLVDPQRPQSVPGERHGDPASFPVHRCHDGLRRRNFVDESGKPGSPLCRLTERKEFVASRERRNARQQNVLDIVEFQHALLVPRPAPPGLSYCIWSSMVDMALFTFSAFLISSAVTYGYSPYSRKLERWCSRTNLTNAGAFVFQSIGNPSRFSKTVLTPVCVKSCMASSVYLSKSVSNIPWYIKYVSLPMSKSTQRK